MDKKKLEILGKFIAGILAFVLFSVLVIRTSEFDKGTDNTYQIVCLGDSNFGNTQNETGTVPLLEKQLGRPVLNGAFGGSMMVSVAGKKTEYHSLLSMHNLAISICNKNFGAQKTAIDTLVRSDYLSYFENTFDKLVEVDFENVEILIIEHGVNDYLGGIPIENAKDLYDTATFSGTLRTIITMLRKEYPNMRIVLVTPAYCAPLSAEKEYRPCDMYDYGGGYLEAYVDAEIEVAEEMGVEIIDLYHKIEMSENNFSTYLYDGLHFGEYGREVVADILADYLLGEAK